ncbi:hypothetical protein F8388_013432 [Cannabis sativa]|uniref:RNase H type-1 domain-containing protein n=1 Tax=Cannabis sativa TaxID=3483 RepID=A0A7J6EXH9_CANSA|nr:hypothetical protein F8388_013432 [Cannabis sativa]KAF4398487.1 hypothetical protein G4B88_025466 [Cannabis sativa]
MEVNPTCEACENDAETLTHALWKCSKTKAVWKLIPWYAKCDLLEEGSMFDIHTALHNRLRQTEFEDAIKGKSRVLVWFISPATAPDMAEAWAILEAIKHIPATVTGPFEIQSDCKTVVDALHSQVSHLSAISTLLHKIKTRLEDFQDYNIIHVHRENNECANMLAKRGLETQTSQIFSHFFPSWLANFCKADLPHLM